MTTLAEKHHRQLVITSRDLDEIKRRAHEDGMIEGKAHSKMSADTVTQFHKMEDKFDKMEEKLDAFKDDFADLRVCIAGMPEKLRMEFDKHYASKETERTLNRIVWAIVTTVGATVALAVKVVLFK